MDEAFAHVEGKSRCVRKDLQPPDGGWGYLVCIGVGMTFMLGFGASSAFGILFHDFFLEQGGAGGLTLVIGVYNGALSIAGFLSGIALKRYSFRQVGLVGAALFILGDVLTIFVARTYQLVFTFGVIRGAGFGVMIPVSYTAFNCYFTRKRTAMMSANQAMSSLASITFPMLVTFLLAEYGFRWTLTLIMAVDLHLVVAMLVMHPVEWHMVAVQGVERDEALKAECGVMVVDSSTADDTQVTKVTVLLGEGKKTEQRDKPQLPPAHKESIQKSIIKTICNNVELDLLKNPRFVSTLVGLGFAFVSDVTYLALEPTLLFSYNFTKFQVATCVMTGAIADLLARFSLAVYTYFFAVDSRKLFFLGTCVTVVCRICLVLSSEVYYVFVVTALSGAVRCSVQVLFPLVLAAAAATAGADFPAALALHILFSGTLMLVADPLIGVVYELSGSYVYCFLAMSVCCMVCVVLWTVEYFLYRDADKGL